MKRIFLTLFIILSFISVSSAQQQSQTIQGAPDTQLHNSWHTFTGQWMPNIDASLIGAENYKTLRNLRYTDGGLEGVLGYSEINSTALPNGYINVKNGYQLKKDEPAETHVIVQSYSGSSSRVYENPTAIPDQGNFTATELHEDASGAGLGRFSSGPQGTVFYCNGVESMVYGGDESRVGAFITSTAVIADEITDPKDFTKKVQNKIQTGNEVATIGGGNDISTKLLVHCDDGEAFDDSSTGGHVDTAVGGLTSDTEQLKFGTASGKFDGTDDYVWYPDNLDWYLWEYNICIDFWIRIEGAGGANGDGIFTQRTDATHKVELYLLSKQVIFKLYDGANTLTLSGSIAGLPVDTWNHIAIIRGWGGGDDDWALCVNGTAQDTDTKEILWQNLTGNLEIGRFYNEGTASTEYFEGWIDEFRISKQNSRWASEFTPPARAYQNAGLYGVIGSPRPLQGFKLLPLKDGVELIGIYCLLRTTQLQIVLPWLRLEQSHGHIPKIQANLNISMGYIYIGINFALLPDKPIFIMSR